MFVPLDKIQQGTCEKWARYSVQVNPDDTLDVMLHRMGVAGLKTLPVIRRKDVHKLEGIVTIEDLLKVYGL